MYPNFDEILEELSYKVGIVDLTNESHKQILVKLLRERGVDSAQMLADRASVVFEYIKENSPKPKKVIKEVVVKGKDSGNIYTVKTFNADKHDKPTPAEVEKSKKEPEVNYDKLTADQKKKMVDAKVDKNNSEFDASENKQQFAIETISARNEDINKAHMLPPGTPGSSFAENNGAKYINNFFNN